MHKKKSDKFQVLKQSQKSKLRSSIGGGILFALLFILLYGNIASAEVVDIMLVYDTTATSWVASNGGMEAFSQDTVNRMNQAMQNSTLGHSFRLVHSMSVNFTTTSNGTTTLINDLASLQVLLQQFTMNVLLTKQTL